MPNPKCVECQKTVYPMEAITAIEKTWHKICFKCQDEGCDIRLNLKSYTGVEGKVYCNKHVPKEKPTALTVDGSMSLSLARDAPKVSVVSNEKRGAEGMERPIGATVDGDLHMSRAKEVHEHAVSLVSKEKMGGAHNEHNLQVADVATTNARAAPKVATVNDQVRPGAGERNAQVADMALSNALAAPKVDNVNQQIRGELAGERNAQVADMTLSNALAAPKVDNVNQQIRGELAGERNAQVADMTLSNALAAPKVDNVNQQIRGELAGERNAQVADLALSNALNAPKLGTINDQIRLQDGEKPQTPSTIY